VLRGVERGFGLLSSLLVLVVVVGCCRDRGVEARGARLKDERRNEKGRERERGDEEGIVESRVVFRLFLGEMWREKRDREREETKGKESKKRKQRARHRERRGKET
jgi:hypothetical protein